ncbi:nicotinate (nicotinamide) nucleotide adenylyltransferase [bacterium]|nr:nicotinate (nicotinamide) nucleotide adenylyltransferase [bacterium]
MTICIFPGTFNPIHEGHLKMAEFALEKFKFEKIIFIPAYIPPHKEIDSSLSEHRYNMVKLAIEKNPKFEISDIEYKNEGKSYSLITVKKIMEQYCIKDRLNFIIGTDAFAKIESWYKAEDLKKLVHFIVFPRKGDEINGFKDWDWELTDMNYIDISSTEIREGVKKNKDLEGYIKKYGLYKI